MTGRIASTPGCAASEGSFAASIENATALCALLTRPSSSAPNDCAVKESSSCWSSSLARCARCASRVRGSPESSASAWAAASGDSCNCTQTSTLPFAFSSCGAIRPDRSTSPGGKANSLTSGAGTCCARNAAGTKTAQNTNARVNEKRRLVIVQPPKRETSAGVKTQPALLLACPKVSQGPRRLQGGRPASEDHASAR